MNAMRQILTPDLSGNILIQVPAEWKQQPVEVILLPTDLDLETVMDYIGYKAAQRGLTSERLADLLNEE